VSWIHTAATAPPPPSPSAHSDATETISSPQPDAPPPIIDSYSVAFEPQEVETNNSTPATAGYITYRSDSEDETTSVPYSCDEAYLPHISSGSALDIADEMEEDEPLPVLSLSLDNRTTTLPPTVETHPPPLPPGSPPPAPVLQLSPCSPPLPPGSPPPIEVAPTEVTDPLMCRVTSPKIAISPIIAPSISESGSNQLDNAEPTSCKDEESGQNAPKIIDYNAYRPYKEVAQRINLCLERLNSVRTIL